MNTLAARPAYAAALLDALDAWVKRFRTYADGGEPADAARCHPEGAAVAKSRDCFVYFINGAKIRAPAAATAFIERLSRAN